MSELNERHIIDMGVRLLFLALFLYAAIAIVAPLAGIVLWAVILAVAVYPVFDWLARVLGGRRVWAATLLVLIGLALTIGPLAASAAALAEYVTRLTQHVADGTFRLPPLPERVDNWDLMGPRIKEVWALFDTNIGVAMDKYGSVLINLGTAVLTRLAGLGIGLLAMALSVIVMGLMLSPGPVLGRMARSFGNRVFAPKGSEFVDLAAATVRNVSRGVLGVAAIQAFLAGVVMFLFGVEMAGPLALICLILGIVQIGPAPVILPVILWAFSSMSTGMAILFAAIMVPVMIMDNFLRPIFIARGLQTPILVILVGVIGGVLSAGIVGIFIGPVILSVFYELVVAWMNTDPDKAATDPETKDASGTTQ